ncbi:MAG TPA: response regulator [Acidobacteriota bacterium]|nr:response regulator [Acidobacteriota bacterium]
MEAIGKLKSKTVLVVEDEASVRELVGEVLQRNGYEVLKAENGRQAMQLAFDSDSIELVLTDLEMPDVTGVELADRLQAYQPRLKILLMSGYSHSLLSDRGVLKPGTALLEKPFNTSTLLQKVNQLLFPQS